MHDGQPPRMTSHRPYLLRALYAWIADNGMTPHLLVDALRFGVEVPPFAVSDGRVVLNVAQRAVASLEMGNDLITFTARFSGVSHAVRVPVNAVLAIYARETGQGMALPEDMPGSGDAPGPSALGMESGAEHEEGGDGGDDSPPSGGRRGGHLRVVK